MVSMAMRLATSPAFPPPIPSQTTYSPSEGSASKQSSFCGRLRPMSDLAKCSRSTDTTTFLLCRETVQTGTKVLSQFSGTAIPLGQLLLQRAVDDVLRQRRKVVTQGLYFGMRMMGDGEEQCR